MYERYLTCLGSICGCLCCTYSQVTTSTIGMMEHFGKFKKVCHPGLNYYTPFVQQIKPISLQTRVVDMQKQTVYTKDNMSLMIDTVLFYRITDPFKATYIVKDILASIMQLTFVTLRTVCGEYVSIYSRLRFCRICWRKELRSMRRSKSSSGRSLSSGGFISIIFCSRICICLIS